MIARRQKQNRKREKIELEKNLSLNYTIHENKNQVELVTQIALPQEYEWHLTIINAKPPFKSHITSIVSKINAGCRLAVCRTLVTGGEKLKVVLTILKPTCKTLWISELIFKAFIPDYKNAIFVEEKNIEIRRERPLPFFVLKRKIST